LSVTADRIRHHILSEFIRKTALAYSENIVNVVSLEEIVQLIVAHNNMHTVLCPLCSVHLLIPLTFISNLLFVHTCYCIVQNGKYVKLRYAFSVNI